jgi:hypothetical protein
MLGTVDPAAKKTSQTSASICGLYVFQPNFGQSRSTIRTPERFSPRKRALSC